VSRGLPSFSPLAWLPFWWVVKLSARAVAENVRSASWGVQRNAPIRTLFERLQPGHAPAEYPCSTRANDAGRQRSPEPLSCEFRFHWVVEKNSVIK
jgi:hypothetical protein